MTKKKFRLVREEKDLVYLLQWCASEGIHPTNIDVAFPRDDTIGKLTEGASNPYCFPVLRLENELDPSEEYLIGRKSRGGDEDLGEDSESIIPTSDWRLIEYR